VSGLDEEKYAGLRRLGELGREIERQRGPDPYPRPTGPAPTLEELRGRGGEIECVASRHGATALQVFGSVARGDAGPGSDLDVLVNIEEGRGLLELAALQNELEDLLGCPVHVTTTGGLRQARAETRKRIEQEAVRL
jgi:predicted nucleotidyltransferase